MHYGAGVQLLLLNLSFHVLRNVCNHTLVIFPDLLQPFFFNRLNLLIQHFLHSICMEPFTPRQKRISRSHQLRIRLFIFLRNLAPQYCQLDSNERDIHGFRTEFDQNHVFLSHQPGELAMIPVTLSDEIIVFTKQSLLQFSACAESTQQRLSVCLCSSHSTATSQLRFVS